MDENKVSQLKDVGYLWWRKDTQTEVNEESLTAPFYFLKKKLSEANTAKCYYLLSVNDGYMVYNSLYSIWLTFYNF